VLVFSLFQNCGNSAYLAKKDGKTKNLSMQQLLDEVTAHPEGTGLDDGSQDDQEQDVPTPENDVVTLLELGMYRLDAENQTGMNTYYCANSENSQGIAFMNEPPPNASFIIVKSATTGFRAVHGKFEVYLRYYADRDCQGQAFYAQMTQSQQNIGPYPRLHTDFRAWSSQNILAVLDGAPEGFLPLHLAEGPMGDMMLLRINTMPVALMNNLVMPANKTWVDLLTANQENNMFQDLINNVYSVDHDQFRPE
jgi:hypothetical protein